MSDTDDLDQSSALEVSLGVAGVVVEGGCLLLVRRARPPGQGSWSLPGGKVAAGESLEEAVAREVLEETGLEVTVGQLLGTAEIHQEGYHYVVLDFVASPCSPGLVLIPGDDALEARWVALGDVASLDLTGGLAEWLLAHGVLD
jgi:8-oxo-dGTP diphosphatase